MVHVPVMLDEVKALIPADAGRRVYLDGTLGQAGHACALMPEFGAFVGYDRDPEAIAVAKEQIRELVDTHPLSGFEWQLFDQSYDQMIPMVARLPLLGKAMFVLLDLGIGSHQFEHGRGFSFQASHEPLDMRFDPESGDPAYELLKRADLRTVDHWMRRFGEVPRANMIAAKLIEAAQDGARTVGDFVRILPAKEQAFKELARIFQGIRIGVNDELGHLERFLGGLEATWLQQPFNARLVVITFHSLEDRMVKQIMQAWQNPCTCPPKTPVCICGKPQLGQRVGKGVGASVAEVTRNSRARSARVRAFDFSVAGAAA